MAWEAHVDYVKMTSPFGPAKAQDQVQRVDPRDLKAALRGAAVSRPGATAA